MLLTDKREKHVSIWLLEVREEEKVLGFFSACT